MHRFFALTLIAALPLAGCASAPAVPPKGPAPAAASTVPADDDLNAALWTQVAVEHDLVFEEIYRNARRELDRALADPAWDALPHEDREGSVGGLPPAIIVDVDEAVLDNSPYQARLIASGEEFGEYSWSSWCKEEAARALPGALAFARYAAERGVRIFYLSNRAKDLDQVTLENLRKQGFPVASDDVFLGLGTVVPDCEQYGSDKGCRRRLVGRGYRVLMQFGDQVGDFVDVVANVPGQRRQVVEPYMDWIGERWWVLPNPTYGSWEPATFNNDWSLPRETRRRFKKEALHDH